MTKPIVLDLFACEGGAAAGYQAAGFTVLSVDMEKKFSKRNPADGWRTGDALGALKSLIRGDPLSFALKGSSEVLEITLDMVFLIHMSPPCQGYTRGNAGRETSWPKLIPQCRDLAIKLEKPFVIENVQDARYAMQNPIPLCGCMFDLSAIDTDGVKINLQRLRLFETSWNMESPRACNHSKHEWVAGAYGGARRDKYDAKFVRKGGYVPKDKSVVMELLGVQHDMTWKGLFECIPPAYSEYIGKSLLAQRGYTVEDPEGNQ